MLGAGVTGLAAAVGLRDAGHDVVVLEAEERPGGVIRSERIDGFLVEHGAESVRGGAPAVRALLDRLGLTDRVVTASAASSARLLLHGGRLVAVPSSPLGLLWTPLLPAGAGLRLFAEPFVPARPDPRETVLDFARRRLGAGAAEALLPPVIGGITGGDPAALEASTVVARLWRWERDHGSLARGMFASRGGTVPPRGSFTFPEGLGELVEALVAAVGPALRLGRPVERIERAGGRLRVHAGEALEVDRVVITTAPEVAARLLPELAPPPLPRAPIASVHLGFRAEDVPGGLPGFGWLVHPRERRDLLGCLWVSGTFPSHAPPDRHLLRVMVGGTRDPGQAERPEAALVDHARAILREVQGIRAEPVLAHVARARADIPQYPPGWGAFLERARAIDGVRFAGWYWGGFGLADGLASAAEVATST